MSMGTGYGPGTWLTDWTGKIPDTAQFTVGRSFHFLRNSIMRRGHEIPRNRPGRSDAVKCET